MEAGTAVLTLFGPGIVLGPNPNASKKLAFLVRLDEITLHGEVFKDAILAFKREDLKKIP